MPESDDEPIVVSTRPARRRSRRSNHLRTPGQTATPVSVFTDNSDESEDDDDIRPGGGRFKNREYYPVARIFNWEMREGTRWFRIKWKHWPDVEEDSWVPEDNLDGCVELLDRFIRVNNLSERTVRRKVGFSGVQSYEPRNWVEVESIIGYIATYRERYAPGSQLPVLVFNGEFGGVDSIYVWPHLNHCFVLLHLVPSNTVVLVDGGNHYNDIKGGVDLHLVGKAIRNLKYIGQKGVDFCGSSAVCIALRLMQMHPNVAWYDLVGWPQILHKIPSITSTLTNVFHKFPSEVLQVEGGNLSKKRRLACSCGKTFSKNPVSLSNHVRICKFK